MQSKLDPRPARLPVPLLYRSAMALTLSLSLCATGCLSPLHQHATALAAATAPVVDQAAAAYSSANSIHFMRTDYDAIAQFDAGTPVYNPRTVPPLMSAKDIQVRLAVLAAFQAYVQSVVAITSGTDSPELQAASTSAGQDLSSLGSALAPSIDSVLGIAATAASTTVTTVATTTGNTTTATSTTSSTPAAAPNPITPTIANGVSAAVDALGQFLISRKVKKELPPIIVSMDPHVKVLCDLLASDITILKGIEDRDYNSVINRQTLFILEPASKLDTEERRKLIMQLPAIARRQQTSDQQLTQLSAAIVRLELTHHALAAEAQGNNPESLKSKLGDLEAAGKDIGKFYTSLSSD